MGLLLELEHLSKRYGRGLSKRTVLRDVSLVLEPGELVTIWGRRRSGKSSLLRIVTGVEAPDSGVVRFAGHDLASLGDVLGGGIGYCQGSFLPAEGRLVFDQLIVSQLARGVASPVAVSCAESALARCGVEQCARLRPRELTGAEAVRVSIARALALRPRLIVIDEPTLDVDVLARDEILLLLRSLADEGVAVLASTGEATGLAGSDRALALSNGELHGHLAPQLAEVLPSALSCRPAGKRMSEHHPAGAGLLELEGVVKHYHGAGEEVRAVDGVSLVLESGEMVALLGPSGSGKTTLLLLIAALLKPELGVIRYAGRELSSFSEDEACDYLMRDVGFVYQSFYLLPRVSALENASLKLLLGGVGMRAAKDRAAEWLERVGLGDRLEHTPGELSGGERQRVAIARALASEPRLILADEPTGNLDSARSREIVTLLESITHERGAGVLLVTHDAEAAAIADRHCTLRDGKLIEGRCDIEAQDPRAPYSDSTAVSS